ncbi:hypothetical protein N7457_004548 [Penicillium paradoxum]|uniref:uncharacterized protein n=1 Tax=Penicillium paradoxum TaxID=176176 RepID=UPI0025487C25|nr:uncharacterized protein N7457_004548 [Penicillium paradoxum]KAJ5782774.1 hypothetical protein N7457_004548 [Penicillium paradoxum]
MRPSMRLPLREVNFICSSCRIEATPRISPFGQFRRYASDSPGILERTRRSLWGTDKPPGPADPYSGSQIMPDPNAAPEESNPDEQFSLSQGTEGKVEDIENLNWEEMPRLGYLMEHEWRYKGENPEADTVKAWYANENPLTTREAAHQAAVEIALKQIVGVQVTNSTIKEHDPEILAQIKSCKIEGQAEQWGDRLRFPDTTTMENLLRHVANDSSKKVDSNQILEQLKSSGKLENRLYDANATEPISESLRSLPLDNGNVKLAFFTHFSQLTARHISNSVVTASATVGKVFTAQEALRKKTKRLTPVLLHELMDKNGTAALPNVKISDVRQTRHHNDEDLGRKKAIVTALFENGLITKSLGQKRARRWDEAESAAA